MEIPRRQFLHLLAGAAALPAASRVARAQAYPSRPVRIIVGYPAGAATDIVARLIRGGIAFPLRLRSDGEEKRGPDGFITYLRMIHTALSRRCPNAIRWLPT